MKLGFPNYPRGDIYNDISWIAENGFDFIDLFLEPDKADIASLDLKQLHKAIVQSGLDTVGHTAWYLPIGSPFSQLRDTAVSVINNHIDFLAELECPKMTVHANWPSSMFSVHDGIAFQLDSLNRIVDYAAQYSLKVMYEPIGIKCEDVITVAEIVNSIDDLYFHLDVGHANLFGRNPRKYIRKLKQKLIHVHLHDNDGQRDLHLPLDSGSLDWKGVLDELSEFYTDTVTLEVFSTDRKYAVHSKEKVQHYLNGC
jgi:sugar phosphate isomerase/epimerase